MDGTDIFRKLIHGAKFDMKRFRSDAEKLKIVKQQPTNRGAISNGSGTKQAVIGYKQHSNQVTEGVAKKRNNSSSSQPAKRARLEGKITSSQKDSRDNSDYENESSDFDDDDDDDIRDDSSIGNDDDGATDSDISMQEQNEDDIDTDDSEGENGKEAKLQILGDMRLSAQDIELNGSLSGKKAKQKNKKNKSSELTIDKAAQLHQEQINRLRNVQRIHVHGTDIPDPVRTFEELSTQHKVSQRLLDNVKAAGFVEPTPIETQAMPVMLQRRELMACAPTGSGKTLAFVLPVLHGLGCEGGQKKGGGVRALILSPTRELARQTYNEFKRMGDGLPLRIHFISKTAKYDQSGSTVKGGAFRKYDIVVTTPNRLIHLLKQDTPLILLNSVEWLIVDECDKLFEEGKSGFRDQLATIYKACDSQYVRRAMFSATYSHDVEEWCRLNLDNVIQVYIGARNSATETIDQALLYVGDESGKLLAIRDIIRKGLQPPVLVFVQSKERAKELFHELIYDGINVDVIHADRTQTQRDNSVASFRAGRIWVLICTELMGRGIDFKGVNLVINYDFPNSAVSYIHRIGRTGRAGRQGKAVTFFTDEDSEHLRSIVNVIRGAGCVVPDYMLQIKPHGRKMKKKLAKSVPQRDTIATDLRYRQKVQVIAKSKKGKINQYQGSSTKSNKKQKKQSSESDLKATVPEVEKKLNNKKQNENKRNSDSKLNKKTKKAMKKKSTKVSKIIE